MVSADECHFKKELNNMRPMLPLFRGEHDSGNHHRWNPTSVCTYLYGHQQTRNLLHPDQNGYLLDVHNSLVNTSQVDQNLPGFNDFLYVITADGELYVSKRGKSGHFHHSSLVAGAPVWCAGELEIKSGVVHYMNNASGHYKPTRSEFDLAVAHLAIVRKVRFSPAFIRGYV